MSWRVVRVVEGAALEITFFRYSPAQKLNTEAYRSGHNGPDSKTNALFGSSPLKNLDFMGLFSYH